MAWSPLDVFSTISLAGAILVLVALPTLYYRLARQKSTSGSTQLLFLALPAAVVLIYVFFTIRQMAASGDVFGLGDAFGILAGFILGLFSLAVLQPRSGDSFFTQALDSMESGEARRRIAYIVIGMAVLTLLGAFATYLLPLILRIEAPKTLVNAAQGTVVGVALAIVAHQYGFVSLAEDTASDPRR